MSKRNNQKKPFYQKLWFWIILIVLILIAVVSVDPDKDPSSESTASAPSPESETEVSESESSSFDFSIEYYDNFRNDVTGKWRKALVSTSEPIQDYALDYYREYFGSDDEVHVIYNFSLNTVNCMKVSNDEIFVSITDYVKGEEHDAKVACSGDFVGEYHISIESGDVTYSSFE